VSGAANRRRGADAERMVVNYLRANGYPHARRHLAGDGRQPGDIDGVPFTCIEVKDRKSSSWPGWQRQAQLEAGDNRRAVVVRRTRGNPNVGEWVARWEDPRAEGGWWHGTFGEFIEGTNP